jgi:predicted small metal-binding protein
MRKILECGVVIPGCDFVARAANDIELLGKAADHLRTVHDVVRMSEQLKTRVRTAIRDEAGA